jgi:hypothetical protein
MVRKVLTEQIYQTDGDVMTTSTTIQINQHLSVELDHETVWSVVDGKRIHVCRFAICNIPVGADTSDVTDVDTLLDRFGVHENEYDLREQQNTILPSDELFVHASNLTAWAENDYDPRLIDSKLGFPLLSHLYKVDTKAEWSLFETVKERWNNGNYNSRLALFEMVGIDIMYSLEDNGIVNGVLDFILCIDTSPDRHCLLFPYFKAGKVTEEEYLAGLSVHTIGLYHYYTSTHKNSKFKYSVDHMFSLIYEYSRRNERRVYPDPVERITARAARVVHRHQEIYMCHYGSSVGFYSPVISDPIDYPSFLYITDQFFSVSHVKDKSITIIIYPRRSSSAETYYITAPPDVTDVFVYHPSFDQFWSPVIFRYSDGRFEKDMARFTNIHYHVITKTRYRRNHGR